MKSVDVLLASYNGEKYIEQQLDSVLSQTYQNIKVIIRDDCSTDKTSQVLAKYQNNYPDKILILASHKNLGSTGSFYELLKASTSDYIMFCDQDDIWNSDKVSSSLESIASTDNKVPSLVFTDLTVVNQNLAVIDSSFLSSLKIDANWLIDNSYKLLCQNPAAGCTIMINKKSKDALLNYGEFPSPLVHDHWIIVYISLIGKIKFLNTPTIQYRQHDNNQVGAQQVGFKYFLDKLLFSLSSTIKHDLNFIKLLKPIKKFSITKYVYYKLITNLRRIF